jgi:hypothetical protein
MPALTAGIPIISASIEIFLDGRDISINIEI